MKADWVRKRLSCSDVTQTELTELVKQAFSAGQRELAWDIQDVIDDRFAQTTVEIPEPTGEVVATFGPAKKTFRCAVDAYLWLLERFLEVRPTILSESPDLIKSLVPQPGSSPRNYRFACTRSEPFQKSPHLTNGHSSELKNGWFANTNLNNVQKFGALERLGWAIGLEHNKDWSFSVPNPSDALLAQMNRPSADDLLAEINDI